MLIYKKGDILNATENIIAHQVNADGIMGGGLAKQIASTYPNVEERYKKHCRLSSYNYERLNGTGYLVKINENQQIANCFTQRPNFDTDYSALVRCFGRLLKNCKENNKTICIPYKYGSGIANGNWEYITKLLEELSNENEVDIVIYQLEK